MQTGLRAFLLSSSESGRLKAYPDGAMVWNEAGRITFIGSWKDRPTDERIRWEDQGGKLVTPARIHRRPLPLTAISSRSLRRTGITSVAREIYFSA